MKKMLLIAVIFCLTVQYLFAQKIIIYDTLNLKKGIYKNFYEFKYNSPSIPFNYFVFRSKDKIDFLKRVESYKEHFSVNIDKEEAKSIGEIFGFCDGNHIYINPKLPKLGANALFSRVLSLCKLTYFYQMEFENTYNGGKTSVLREKIIDLESKKTITLYKKNLGKLLEKFPKLYNEFNEDKRKKERFKYYINAYNELQNSIVDINKYELLLLNLDSFIFKNKDDATSEEYFNRLSPICNTDEFTKLVLDERHYSNGAKKYSGILAKHKLGANPDFYYQIGTWEYYFKNGKLKKVENYNIRSRRHGEFIVYDENGNVIERNSYKNDVKIK